MLVMLTISFVVVITYNYLVGYYVPLIAKRPIIGGYWSPRLFVCKKLLGPIDVGLILFMFFGGLLGIKEAGINMLLYEAFVGLGLMLGLNIMRKFLVPKWTKQYQQLLDTRRM